MSTTDHYRHEKMHTYPKCANCRLEVTDSTYEHALGRLCKLCYNATRDPKTFEARGKMLHNMREAHAQ